MNVVLLGSSGQIGKAILNKLIRIKKLKIICVGRQNQTKLLLKNVEYFEWDFVNFEDSKVKFLNNANVIVNCIGKNFNTANNLNYLNFLFIKYLLRYISKKKLNLRLINLSSISVYGANQKYLFKDICVNESFLEAPYDLYSNSKYKSDHLIKKNTLYNKNNFTYTIFRISNVIGTDRNSNLFKVIFFFIKTWYLD
jgi:nucleoside-diphosphate-sugar epimerase